MSVSLSLSCVVVSAGVAVVVVVVAAALPAATHASQNQEFSGIDVRGGERQ